MTTPDPAPGVRSPTREEWLRLEPFLDLAMGLDAAEARALLVEPCAGDEALLAWTARFLAGAGDGAFPVSLPPSIVAGAFANDLRPAPDAGARFGAYRIVRELGHGGMGSVFLADRADGQFEQRVAIKLTHRGSGARDGRERFLRERQILARLDHPNVAHLVDGGITSDGQPWFAMEYVDGAQLDAWCDDRRATIEERLALFLSVCDAVQFAHQRLVIHRDLKPSNILVTPQAQVKLLDFGIARLLQDTEAGVTHTGFRTFTPEYASPEQWRGDPVTTGSDVYSLGVVLYELLSGVRPHRLHGAPETEWARIVLEGPVLPPSLALTPEAATARGASVDRLQRRLRDDLDTIALTALRTESARRYRTVDQLAADLRRHLGRHPITARPDTWRYRSAKFVRRHRVGVVAASLVAVSVVGGTAGIAWQSGRALREAARANAARQFLAGVFRESDPASARGDSLTAGEMLDRAARRIDTDFRDQPDVKLDLLLTLGEIYRSLGRLGAADSLASRATVLADSVDDDPVQARAHAQVLLATVRLAAGSLESADSLVRRGIAGLASDTALADAYSVLGTIGRRRYRYVAAESAFRRAISMVEGAKADDLEQAKHWNDFGVMLMDAGRYHAADTALRHAMTLESGRLPANEPGHVLTLMNYAIVRSYLGDEDSALVIGREVLRLQRLNYPDGHERVAEALNTLAFEYMDRGEFAIADTMFRETIGILTRLSGPDDVQVLIARNNAARTRLLAGHAAEAESAFRQVHAHARRVLGNEHGFVSQPLHWIGRALLAQGRAHEARRMLDSALRLAQRTLPPEHGRFADVPAAIAAAALDAGDLAVADSMARMALAHREAHVGRTSVETAEPLLVLARVRATQGRPAAAESLYVRALATLEPHPALAWRSEPARRELRTWQARWSNGAR